MKTFIVSLLFFISHFSKAQQLLDTSRTWNVLECATGGGTYCDTKKYKLFTDTTTGNLNLFFSPDSLGLNWYLYSPSLTLVEDTVYKKVFINGYLLYDFMLNKGDTVLPAGPYGIQNCFPVVVDSVDTFIYSGIPRRRIQFDNYGGQVMPMWIEGIGSTDGIIHSFIRYFMVDADARLLCCDSSGVLIYQSPLYNSCYLILSADDLKKNGSMEISPNPFTDRIYVKQKDPAGKKFELEISDPTGRIMFTTKTQLPEQEIQLPPFPNGLYFVYLKEEDFYSVRKMIRHN